MADEIYDPEFQKRPSYANTEDLEDLRSQAAQDASFEDFREKEHISLEGKAVQLQGKRVNDQQIKKAKALDLTWEFEGTEYALFTANKTGNVGSPIMNPATGVQAGIVFADFAWEDSKPFLDHLNLQLRDERNSRDEESVRKRANVTAQNSRLFKEVVQRGAVVKIDAQGEKTKPLPRSREELLAMAPEIQSQLIDDWLGNFHIQRYLAPGTDDLDMLLSSETSTIQFTAKIGNFKSPAHVLLFTFDIPSADARRNYEDASFSASSKQEGEKSVTIYNINQKAKLSFAKRYFKSVEGVVLGTNGEVEISTESLYRFQETDKKSVEDFKAAFNPHWWIRLADELAGAFNFTGK